MRNDSLREEMVARLKKQDIPRPLLPKNRRGKGVEFSLDEQRDSNSPATHESLEETVIKEEQGGLLLQALNSLPLRQKSVLEMLFFDGLTQSEIADLLGITQSGVNRIKDKALKRLKRNIFVRRIHE